MKKAIFLAVALLAWPDAKAKVVTGSLEKDFVFGSGLQDNYKVTLDVPSGWEVKEVFKKLQIKKSFFEELKLELYSHVPENIGFANKSFKVKDKLAKSEVFLNAKDGDRISFQIYRRISDKGPVILNCSGDSKEQAVINDMVRACRSVRLK